MDNKTLTTQLEAYEKELEMVKAHLYRLDGAIQAVKSLIEQANALDKEAKPDALVE